MDYKAAIFDLDGTLYDYEALNVVATEAVRAFTCARTGITAQRFDTALRQARHTVKGRLGSVAACHNRLLYYQNMLEQLGLPPAGLALEMHEAYWGTLIGQMELFPGALEVLTRLKAEGLKLAVCTDMTAHVQHRKLQKLGVAHLVDALVSSEEAGAEKPAPVMFELCLEKLGLPAGDCFYVGDSLEKDIAGAAAAGMQPVWYGEAAAAAQNAPAKVPVAADYAALEGWLFSLQ